MSGSSGARTLRCERCRGAFSLAELAPQIFCPFCGHQQSAQTLFGELHSYQAAVEGSLRAADHEYEQVAGWARWSQRSPKRNLAVAYGLLVGVPVAIALVAYALLSAGVFDVAGPGFGIVMMGGTYAAVIVYYVWYFASRKKVEARRAAPGEARVACPNCGAPGTLTPGQVVDHCAYCGSSLVPSKTVMLRGLDAARLAHRRARMERYRVERQGMAQLIRYSANNWVMYFYVAPVVLMIGATAVGFSYKMAVGSEPFHPAIFVLWGMVISLIGGMAIFLGHRRAKRRAWAQALTDLARQFGGRVTTTLADWIAWLNAYWAGEFKVTEIYQGRFAHAATLDGCGFPALVLVDPVRFDQHRPARLEVFLAAWIPGLSDGTGRPPQPTGQGAAARAWLGGQGFFLSVTEAGLRASADAPTIKQLHRDPSAAHELAPVMAALAAVAASVGAEPVEPIP